MTNELKDRQDLINALIEKAWSDEKYKQRLINNPREVVNELLREEDPTFEIPEGCSVKVLEETQTELILVIPQNPDDIELDEADLENVADGKCSAFVRCPSKRCGIRIWQPKSKISPTDEGPSFQARSNLSDKGFQ